MSPIAGKRLKTQSVAAPPSPSDPAAAWLAIRLRERETCLERRLSRCGRSAKEGLEWAVMPLQGQTLCQYEKAI